MKHFITTLTSAFIIMSAIYLIFSLPFGFDAQSWPTAAGVVFCIIGVIILMSIPRAMSLKIEEDDDEDEDDIILS